MHDNKSKMRPRLIKGDLERANGRIVAIGRIETDVVKDTYRRWAPIYDHTFGRVSTEGRKRTAQVINESRSSGRILEIGDTSIIVENDEGRICIPARRFIEEVSVLVTEGA